MIKWVKQGWPPIVFFLFIVILWESVVRIYAIESWILPSPSAIFQELSQGLERTQDHFLATVRIALLGLSIGVGIGVVMASVLHAIPLLRRAIYPLILLSQNIPMIALAPLLVVWFGFGDLPKLLVVVLVCFFPVTVSTLDGFTQTDPTLDTYAKMAGASRWQRFYKLEWPSALPAFFSGCKLSATYSVMGAVIAEWLGAERGLGKMMTLASKAYQTERVFVAIVLVVGLSLLLFALITWLEKRVIRWRQPITQQKK